MNNKLDIIINRAHQEALARNHEYVTTEHVLHSVLQEEAVARIIAKAGGNVNNIILKCVEYLDDESLVSPNKRTNPKITQELTRTVKRILAETTLGNSVQDDDIISITTFVHLLYNEDSPGCFFCHEEGITREKIIETMREEVNSKTEEEAFEQYCTDLNKLVSDGKIDPVIGRANEINKTIETLARRRKNNAILVGEPGVGKTAIAEGLAYKIVNKQVPSAIQNKIVYSLDITAMLAGAKFRGEFEERLKSTLKEIQKRKNVIVFIDEIHMIIGSGAAGNNGGMDAANILKPMLQRGDLHCVGATTNEEYRKVFEKDRALVRRFNKVDVFEPTIAETKQILHGLEKHYAEFHGVTYEPGTIDLAVDLAAKHIKQRQMPDKAVDVIDAVGAVVKLAEQTVVTIADIEKQVAKIAGIDVSFINNKESNNTLQNLPNLLKSKIFGQDRAIDEISDSIMVAKSGLREENKPMAAYLAVGPTGTGKTFVAKELAKNLDCKLVRFDMSEYMEKHSVAKLIGAPPGYAGFGDGASGDGLLINEIESNPNCVLLLDEIEKAHPDVFNLFLQVLDDARLTNSKGKTVSFTNVIVLFTSNAGAADADKNRIGFGEGDEKNTGAIDETVKRMFAPEFRNRLDGIIKFNKLTDAEMHQIVNARITELNKVLESKKVHVVFSKAARDKLAKDGYNPSMGARPMARIFQEKIKRSLAKEMLFGALKEGGTVRIDVKDNDFKYEVVSENEVHVNEVN